MCSGFFLRVNRRKIKRSLRTKNIVPRKFAKPHFFWELPYISILICILGVSFILDCQGAGEHFLLWFRSESEYLSRKLLALAAACPKVINHQPILWRSAVQWEEVESDL